MDFRYILEVMGVVARENQYGKTEVRTFFITNKQYQSLKPMRRWDITAKKQNEKINVGIDCRS